MNLMGLPVSSSQAFTTSHLPEKNLYLDLPRAFCLKSMRRLCDCLPANGAGGCEEEQGHLERGVVRRRRSSSCWQE